MIMPDVIGSEMLAPCGVNCMVCYRHCAAKKPCAGCYAGDEGKTEHCRTCKIKNCAASKGLTYCFECGDFPCVLIKNMEKSYTKRYNVSLVADGRYAKEHGVSAFMAAQREKWLCPACGGVVTQNGGQCGECGKQY